MTAIFQVQKVGERFTEVSREILREQFGTLEQGDYKVTIEPAKPKRYNGTRYKYYFGHVMATILDQAGDNFQILNPMTGETKRPANTTDMHECMKMMFNPVIIDQKTLKVRTAYINEHILSLCSKSMVYAAIEMKNGPTENSRPVKGGQRAGFRTDLQLLNALFAA